MFLPAAICDHRHFNSPHAQLTAEKGITIREEKIRENLLTILTADIPLIFNLTSGVQQPPLTHTQDALKNLPPEL